jgi:uncharacterized membrane protein YeaQ/YmgE (transglycosylase-associated protein family)
MEQMLAFVVPMLALAAMTVGWLTDALSPARGYGLLADMAVGVVGGGVVAAVLSMLNRLGDGGLMVTFIAGLAGAALAIAAQRAFWRGPSLAA